MDVKRINGLLWALNALLGAGIAAFVWFYLLFPGDPGHLKDFEADADSGSVAQAPQARTSDAALRLGNPVEKREASGPAPTLFKATLKGTLPSEKDPKQGLAFIKSSGRNVELVAYLGEPILHEGKPYDEYRGWVLAEVSKDRAVFTSASGQRQVLTLDLLAGPAGGAAGGRAGPADAGKANRVGQAYSSDTFKSRLLAQADNRQVWGLDPDEIDWASQNADRIMDQDFQVSPSAGGGIRVEGVTAGSIGAARGLMAGDVVRDVNGQPLNNIADLRMLLSNQQMKQQSGLRITVERAGKPVVLEYRPLPR
jgi:hypothetical protein